MKRKANTRKIKARTGETKMERIKTRHEWITQLAVQSHVVAKMQLDSGISDGELGHDAFNLANCDDHGRLIIRATETLLRSGAAQEKDVSKLLGDLLRANTTAGTFCELAAYDWLLRHDSKITTQVPLDSAEVLSKNGSTLDGKLELLVGSAYFDVKAFGFHGRVAERLRCELEKRLVGWSVLIEGSWDLSIDQWETLLAEADSIAATLASKGMTQHGQLMIRLERPKPMQVSHSWSNPYLLAQENARYPFKYANKFTREAPFILIFVSHPWFGQRDLHDDFAGLGGDFTRAMSRRAFMQFSHNQTPIDQISEKASIGTTLADASKLLSGILFVDVWPVASEDDNGRKSPTWIYLNPRATYRLDRSAFDLIVGANPHGVDIDGFEFDDY